MTTIYVIYHEIFENCNVFTTNKSKIKTIIDQLIIKIPFFNKLVYNCFVRDIKEFEEFQADISQCISIKCQDYI